MFNKILIALDGSALAETVLPYLKKLASTFKSEVHILGSTGRERGLTRMFESYLEKVAVDLRSDGIDARVVVTHGNPTVDILDYAEKEKVNILAVTTHGHGGMTRWLLGSVAEKLVQGTTVPILLVRSKKKTPQKMATDKLLSKILVPLDGSPVGEAALPCVEALANRLHSSVTYLHVTLTLYQALQQLAPTPPLKEAASAISAGGRAYVDSICQRQPKGKFEVHCSVVTGDPAEKILEFSRQSNLIAMSTHGRGGFIRWTLGSVADRVIRGSDVPVLLVKAAG